ncbi:MAG: hypothetical protein CTY11_00330 [Methylomonas sp.]|nr:MAG: hypothetical protein CTY11_00330 [Methylomonas sp.]
MIQLNWCKKVPLPCGESVARGAKPVGVRKKEPSNQEYSQRTTGQDGPQPRMAAILNKDYIHRHLFFWHSAKEK